MSALAFKEPGVGLTPGHADLAHHRVQEVGAVGLFVEDFVPGVEEAARSPRHRPRPGADSGQAGWLFRSASTVTVVITESYKIV